MLPCGEQAVVRAGTERLGICPAPSPEGALSSFPQPRRGQAEPPRHPGPFQHCGACAGRAARPRYQGRRCRAPRPGQAPPLRCSCLPHGRGWPATSPCLPHSPAADSSAWPPLPSRGSRRDKRQRPQTGSAAARAVTSAPPLPEVSRKAPPGVPCERRAPPAGCRRYCAGKGRGH